MKESSEVNSYRQNQALPHHSDNQRNNQTSLHESNLGVHTSVYTTLGGMNKHFPFKG